MVHGKDGSVIVGGKDISQYVKAANLEITIETTEITPYTADGRTYQEGQEEAVISLMGVFDAGAAAVDKILNDIKSDDTIMTYYPGGTAPGMAGYGLNVLQSSYGARSSITKEVEFAYSARMTDWED
jgi:hypothetical protein